MRESKNREDGKSSFDVSILRVCLKSHLVIKRIEKICEVYRWHTVSKGNQRFSRKKKSGGISVKRNKVIHKPEVDGIRYR